LNESNRIKIEVLDLELKTKTIYNSMRAAAESLNISHTGIVRYFKNKQQKPYKGRYIISLSTKV
jgi:hypothetical protein